MTKYIVFCNLENVFFSFIFLVEWMIANPPIIFGKTAQLSCVTPHISSNQHNVTSWLGGKDYSTLTFTGGTADPKKYAEIRMYYVLCAQCDHT
jgi:hypothetical protein